MNRVVIIGAGVGGLTTAAVLAKAGLDIKVLEAHIYPGGCAGTFYHQGYRFDAGATLAGGFYPGGPMDFVARATGVETWNTRRSNPAMVVHLPDGTAIPRWSDERRWQARRSTFGREGEAFFRWQETTADALWSLALRGLPWPPQSPSEGVALLKKAITWAAENPVRHLRPGLLADAFRPASAHLPKTSENLRLFIDAQLLISAQTTSTKANALYAASALDLPRRGAVQIEGGMGAISDQLAKALERHGGRLHLRKREPRVDATSTKTYRIEVERGDAFEADAVVFNLPPWNIRNLLDAPLPPTLRRLPPHPDRGWGAFMIYLGIDDAAIPEGFADHHQVLKGRPLAEGQSIFLSINPPWDHARAPMGKRAVTISTHTRLEPWWQASEEGPASLARRRQQMQSKMLESVGRLLPGIHGHTDLLLDATPITFSYFTGRERGWVGGFPQVNLFQAMPPRLSQQVWMVGDSIFPGQSTAAVALGGLRVARSILKRFNKSSKEGVDQ
jgi:C-3',4' desaturase CrtD